MPCIEVPVCSRISRSQARLPQPRYLACVPGFVVVRVPRQTTIPVFGTNGGPSKLRTHFLARAAAGLTTNAAFGTNGGAGTLET